MACVDEYIEDFEGSSYRRGVKLFSPDSAERVIEVERKQRSGRSIDMNRTVKVDHVYGCS